MIDAHVDLMCFPRDDIKKCKLCLTSVLWQLVWHVVLGICCHVVHMQVSCVMCHMLPMMRYVPYSICAAIEKIGQAPT